MYFEFFSQWKILVVPISTKLMILLMKVVFNGVLLLNSAYNYTPALREKEVYCFTLVSVCLSVTKVSVAFSQQLFIADA